MHVMRRERMEFVRGALTSATPFAASMLHAGLCVYVLCGRCVYSYVSMAISVCCSYSFYMFQLFYLDAAFFYLDIAYVAVSIHVCLKCMFQMLRML